MKRDNELYAFRRHLLSCQFFGPGGRLVRSDKCNCPFHVDGIHRGQRPRRSLRTRSRQLADRRLAELIRELDARLDEQAHIANASEPGRIVLAATQRTVSEAVERFLATHGEIDQAGKFRGDSEYNTFRKYRSQLSFLSSYCKENGIVVLSDDMVDALEGYRRTRNIGGVTWKAERQALVTFFGFCIRRKWISTNPAKDLSAPRNLKPNEVVPYTLREESLILSACDQIGGGKYNRSGARYEQLRARAMALLLRHTALRISDVATIRRDAVSWDQENVTWRVRLRTQKTGEPVHLPMPETLKMALNALPLPRNAMQDCPYYFWNGITSRRAVVGIAERTLAAVFKKSG